MILIIIEKIPTMWIDFLFVVLVFYHFYWYGIPYAIGSAQYARLNNNPSVMAEDCWLLVRKEYAEFINAVFALSPVNIFLEFFDTMHAIAKYFIINYLPKWFYFSWVCWIMVFPFFLPATVKFAWRYNKFKCIRNHSRPNTDHICILNKFGR